LKFLVFNKKDNDIKNKFQKNCIIEEAKKIFASQDFDYNDLEDSKIKIISKNQSNIIKNIPLSKSNNIQEVTKINSVRLIKIENSSRKRSQNYFEEQKDFVDIDQNSIKNKNEITERKNKINDEKKFFFEEPVYTPYGVGFFIESYLYKDILFGIIKFKFGLGFIK